jgi:hypothetical protein
LSRGRGAAAERGKGNHKQDKTTHLPPRSGPLRLTRGAMRVLGLGLAQCRRIMPSDYSRWASQ